MCDESLRRHGVSQSSAQEDTATERHSTGSFLSRRKIAGSRNPLIRRFSRGVSTSLEVIPQPAISQERRTSEGSVSACSICFQNFDALPASSSPMQFAPEIRAGQILSVNPVFLHRPHGCAIKGDRITEAYVLEAMAIKRRAAV
jgi:hypothetical protein